jgi:hypothetical protein
MHILLNWPVSVVLITNLQLGDAVSRPVGLGMAGL